MYARFIQLLGKAMEIVSEEALPDGDEPIDQVEETKSGMGKSLRLVVVRHFPAGAEPTASMLASD